MRSVVASLWASKGEANEGFIADALQAAKLNYLADNLENGLFDVAGFQLYLQ